MSCPNRYRTRREPWRSSGLRPIVFGDEVNEDQCVQLHDLIRAGFRLKAWTWWRGMRSMRRCGCRRGSREGEKKAGSHLIEECARCTTLK